MAAAVANSTLNTAIQQGTVGVSFSGAGFLIFYYIGVLEVLSKLGVLKPQAKLAGASSGALITTSYCGGLSPTEIIGAGHDLAKACREENSCSGSLDRMLRKTLQAHLPPDAWMKCRNKGYLSISAGNPLGPSNPLLVTDFKSQDDLISAAAVSSFIPLWSGSRITTYFRGMEAFDGGYSLQQPCPPDVKYCIRISSKNPSWPQNRGIGSFFSLLGRLGSSSSSSSSSITEAASSYPAIQSTGADGKPDPNLVQLAASSNVDIAPGVFSKMPFSQSQWSDWALSPADDSTLKHMYRLGKSDAEAWAKYVGVPQQQQQQQQQQPQPKQQQQKLKQGKATVSREAAAARVAGSAGQ
ncbi:hypothetical protein OEZ85_009822 [Tetradesmus obliquus]|uniref:Patatin n=1 Tax=Tetradesmus obliquus TaxID=3088 RepID=A0ABY8UAR4_TETOB|nr:hypothetical protein OEZ85_009822 [Tetradesmus obliquus]